MTKWKKKKLNEFCEFSNGLWTGKKPPFQKVGVIRNTNFKKDCLLDDSDIVYLEVEQSQFQKRKLKYGDIILEKSGGGPKQPVGRVVIFDKTEGDFSFSNFTSVIRIKDKDEVDFNFLHRYLFLEYISGATEKMQSHSTGIRNLKFDEYKEIEIPLPPLPEQRRIVSILDEAFAAIAKAKANAEQNLKNAKELFESYLQGVFEKKGEGWEEKTLKELTTHLGDGLHGTPKYTTDGDYYFINGNNLTDGAIEFKESTKRVSIDEYNKHKKNLTNRTVLVSINGTLGNVAFYNGEKIILGKSACYFNLKENIDKGFVKYVLSSQYFINYAHREATGATIKNVSLKSMREFKVPVPPLKEQQTIVRQLDALRAETQKLEAVYQKKIADLEELKKSILQKAFEGEL